MKYQIGGSLTTDAPSYIERQADRELYQALKQGEFCYVLNSRQMGKSSLLVRTKYRLEQEGFKCAAIDMTNIGSENITPLQWYKGAIADLWSGLNLSKTINFKLWWREQEDVSLVQKFSLFIEELLVVYFPNQKIFIFIDEIDSILSLDFSVDDFFALIRFCYNQRAINPEYQRITFAIFGVATPSDLIQNRNRTPFNIGRAIELKGFEFQEALPLATGLTEMAGERDIILKEILTWTEGQPFLTQKLCKLVKNFSQKNGGAILSITSGTEALWVEKIVRSSIVECWQTQDEPEHLRTIRDRIDRNGKRAARMLTIYQQILQEIAVEIDDSREQIELLLSGLVVRQQGLLKVKNRIYQEVFHLNWVEQQLAALRPYSQTFDAWLASKKTDESRLLRGKALKDALTWALGKSLSDLDYQYLAASQELSKKETENALQSLEKANLILSSVRRKVKGEPLRHKIWPGWIGATALCVTSLIIMVRFTGLLQGVEWNALDQFFRCRPLEATDSRIAIVTVDESDITQVGKWPMSDRIMTQLIKNIKTHNPQALGLDLYRDLPVEPGYKELIEVFQNTPNLIGIEKVVGGRVAPPPILKKLEQVGFVDVVLDGDGKVRRGLMTVQIKNKVHQSFGLQLALRYLQKKGVSPKRINQHQWRLGRAILVPFDGNDGGYVRANSGGYQILLNFRGVLENFQTISLTEVLKNEIPPGLMNDRIVLVGATAESLNDLFYTPYSNGLLGAPKRTAGVAIHANLISQILSAALDGRPGLRVWSEAEEQLWILVWSLVGAVLTWRLKFFRRTIAILFAGLVLLSISYLGFLQGWWWPVVPPMLGLVGSTFALYAIVNKRLEQLQLRRILELLLEQCSICPTAGRIAIEYLKQSESDKNQTFIEQWLIDNNLR